LWGNGWASGKMWEREMSWFLLEETKEGGKEEKNDRELIMKKYVTSV
jgi:hypothetical protein